MQSIMNTDRIGCDVQFPTDDMRAEPTITKGSGSQTIQNRRASEDVTFMC